MAEMRASISAVDGPPAGCDARNRCVRGIGRIFTDQLPLQRIARIRRFAQFKLGLIELRLKFAKAAEVILLAAAGPFEILQLELLEPVFRLEQLRFVRLDLFLDELARLIRILPLAAQTGFDEQGHHRLNDLLGAGGLLVAI
jgi:hypothetical protein